MARKKVEEPPDPDKLERAEAGRYRSGDGRFEVSQEAAGAWYATDAERIDELGLPRVNGPYPTLAAVREALPELRKKEKEPVSLEEHRRKRVKDAKTGDAAPAEAAKKPERPPPPPTWLERLEGEEQARARRLLRAAERAGLPDPERLVRVDLEGLGPRLAPAILIGRIWREAIEAWDGTALENARKGARRALPDDAKAAGEALAALDDDAAVAIARIVARETTRRLLDALAAREDDSAGLPRCTLEEVDERGDRTGRRIGISSDDLDAAARPER